MTTIILLLVVAGLIGGFSYFTNAGFGDRRPRLPKKGDQASPPDVDAPPPQR